VPYSYLGNMGMLSAFGTMHALFHRLGASRLERTICGGQNLGLQQLVGSAWTDPEHMADARLLIVWGMDPISTSVHTWDIIHRAMQKGARLVVIDPYRSRTAARAHRHLRVRPGTDGALALGLLHVILGEGLEDGDYVARHASGIEALRAQVAAWTPEAAARKNFGVSAKDLTPAQAARLAAIVPKPLSWRAARPGPYVQRRSGAINRNARAVRREGLTDCVL